MKQCLYKIIQTLDDLRNVVFTPKDVYIVLGLYILPYASSGAWKCELHLLGPNERTFC
jgi:hypothetical protein